MSPVTGLGQHAAGTNPEGYRTVWIVIIGLLSSMLCWSPMAAGQVADREGPGAAPTPVATAPPVATADAATTRRGEAYSALIRAALAKRRGAADDVVLAELARAQSALPEEVPLLVELAEWYALLGRSETAESLIRRALELEPASLLALRWSANFAVDRARRSNDPGHVQEALRLLDELERRAPGDDPWVLHTTVRLRLASSDLPGAIAAGRELVAHRPGDLLATRTLAQALMRDGQQGEALRTMLQYQLGHPGESELLGFVDQLTRSLGAWAVVAEEVGRVTRFDGATPGLLRLVGEALLREGKSHAALDALESAHRAEPSSPSGRLLLARTYRAARRHGDAVELLTGLANEQPDNAELRLELAQALDEQRDTEGALQSYRAAVLLLEGHERAAQLLDPIRRRMATIHLSRSRTEEARQMAASLATPDHPEALEIRCRLALVDGDLASARALAGELRAAGEEGLGALLEAEIHVEEERWSKAAERFGEATRLLGTVARRRAAASYHHAGRLEDATAVLRGWVAEAPENADARYHLADLLNQIGDFDAAERELREVLRLEPDHAPALNYLGYSLAERNDRLEEALNLVQRALVVDPYNAAFLDSLGWVYYRMGRFGEARQPLERAARDLPLDPTILEHLGDVYARLALRELAVANWSRALQHGAEHPEDLRAKIDRERQLLEARAPEASSPEFQQPAAPTVEAPASPPPSRRR